MFTSTLSLNGTTLPLQRSIVIGRAPATAPAVVAGSADPLAIEDDSQLSRHHLQLAVNEVGVSATDLGSGNGTAVERNGSRHDLDAMEPMELRSGDVLIFGRQRAIVGLDADFDATVLFGEDEDEDEDEHGANEHGGDPTPPSPPRASPAPARAAPPATPPSPATAVLPNAYVQRQPPAPTPAPTPAPGSFVPGRADQDAGSPGFVPGRAGPSSAPPPVSAGGYGQAPQQQPSHGGGYQVSTTPATFGARLWATILDSVIYGLVFTALIVAAVVGFYIHPAVAALIGVVGYFGIVFLYWRQVATTGQSWGRRIAKVRVVDARTGRPIGYGKTFLRFFVANISGSIFYLGYLWMLWDDKQQTWHDKAAGSVVVKLD